VTATAGRGTAFVLPRRSLLLVAGIPGAGKSTLLCRAVTPSGTRVLDSDPIRDRLGALLPPDTPYRRYRALVHLCHRVQIVLALFGALGPVVVHLPATGALTRGLVMLAALAACRARYLLWVDAEPDAARRGQHQRGRVLGSRCFDRHSRGGTLFARRLRAGYRPVGWRQVLVIDREQAANGLILATAAPSAAGT
jgi:AAA domain-containing protein